MLKQIDAATPGGFASGDASGLVRDSLSKLDRIQDKIENIDMRVESFGRIDKIGRTSEKLTRRTSFAAEVLRIVLLLVTAFLVHVILARIKV